MAWPYTKAVNWGLGEEPSKYDDQPVDANTIIYAGCPVGANAGSTPANCARPCAAADVFLGMSVRTVDNLTADASVPNILYNPNVGDGTTGVNGAKVRLLVEGLIRFDSQVPNGTGTAGSITGLAGTQADVGTKVYYNGTGFTNSAGGNTLIGTVVAVGTTLFGSTYFDVRLRSDPIRNS